MREQPRSFDAVPKRRAGHPRRNQRASHRCIATVRVRSCFGQPHAQSTAPQLGPLLPMLVIGLRFTPGSRYVWRRWARDIQFLFLISRVLLGTLPQAATIAGLDRGGNRRAIMRSTKAKPASSTNSVSRAFNRRLPGRGGRVASLVRCLVCGAGRAALARLAATCSCRG